jgi:peptidoglycan/xylan/chitin deacetylase (PgdA/CDA1 family)
LRHPAVPPPEPPTVTILCYHTFDAKVKTPFTVSSARFNEEMRYLWVQKIPVIPLSALLDHFEKKTPLPDRSVVITIDDGYKTAKDIAWPILARYHFPFTLYVYTHAISRLPASLTWNDLREMAAFGVDIQSHSVHHPLLTHPGKGMITKTYQAWIDDELVESKRKIEAELHQPVTSIAYPYGGYDERIVDRTRIAGYKMGLTCDDGDVTSTTNPLLLNRRLVFRQTSLKSYVQYFRSRPIEVADPYPRDGERVKDIPTEIRARILNLKAILPETAQILVDKLGSHWRPVPIDPKTGEMRYPIPGTASRRGYYFVSLVAKDRLDPSLQRETSWLFIIRQNVSKR